MKKKSNAIIYILVIMLVLCLAAGGVGYYKSISSNEPASNNKNNNKKEYKVTYKYYLDGIETSEEVKDETEQVASTEFEGAVENKRLYSFDKYTCTNEVEGTWDDTNWKFTPTLTADTTCRLYFIRNTHEVKVTLINASFPGDKKEATVKVEKDKEVEVTITPSAGYKYTNTDCSNRTETEYDVEKSILKIKSATKNSECVVTYGINAYEAKIKVQNGSVVGEETKRANYGETVTFTVSPAENYDNPTIDCTNGQTGTYEVGTTKVFKINAISNDTTCTLSFTIAKNKVTLNVENGTVINNENSEHPNIKETTNNGTVTFGISKNDGYLLTEPELSCTDENVTITNTTGIITISKVTKDVTCTVKLKKDETTNENNNGAGNE